jgi:hypothetical protein
MGGILRIEGRKQEEEGWVGEEMGRDVNSLFVLCGTMYLVGFILRGGSFEQLEN